MDSTILVPVALVLGVVGAVTGALGLWGWILSRQKSQAGEAGGGGDAAGWRNLQREVGEVSAGLEELRQQMTAATGVAIQRIDVDYGLLPGQSAPNSALVALRDGSGQNGLVLTIYGNPQFRVLVLHDGKLQTPDGQVLDMETKFLRKLELPQS